MKAIEAVLARTKTVGLGAIAAFISACSADAVTRAISGPDAFKPTVPSVAPASVATDPQPLSTAPPASPPTFSAPVSTGPTMTLPLTFTGTGGDQTTPKFYLKRGLVRLKAVRETKGTTSAQLRNDKGTKVGPFINVFGVGTETLEWAISSDGWYDLIVNRGDGNWTLKVLTWRALCVDLILQTKGTKDDCDGAGAREFVGSKDQ